MRRLVLFVIILLPSLLFSQKAKKPLDFSVYNSWNYINTYSISKDGHYVCYEIKPYKGDSRFVVYDVNNKKKIFFHRGSQAQISPNSNFVAFRVSPQYKTVRQMKMQKVKENKLPKDSLYIYTFAGKINKYANLKSFQIAKEQSDWLSFILSMPKDTSKNEGKEKIFDRTAPKVGELHIFNPLTQEKFIYKNITESDLSRNGRIFAFVKLQNDSLQKSTLYIFDSKKRKLNKALSFAGLITKIKVDNQGKYVAFLYSKDTIKQKIYSIYLYNISNRKNIKIADTLSPQLPKLWTASVNGKIFFSRDDKRLFFGSALRPLPAPKDTLLESEKVKVDIWSWTDKLLQPQQIAEKKQELKRTYLTEYLINEKKLYLLADTLIRKVELDSKAENNYFLGRNYIPYERESSWDASFASDIYRINAETGEKKLILKKANEVSLSPNGNFLLYYRAVDSCWFIKNIKTGFSTDVTKKLKFAFYDEENDYPKLPDSYGIISWNDKSKFVLIYDRYDIWQINMDKNFSAKNITRGYGRRNKIRLQNMWLDNDKDYISAKQTLYLKGFNEKTKGNSYYSLDLSKSTSPKKLYGGDYALDLWTKAKNSKQILFRRQTFKEYPDLWISNTSMKKPIKISETNPQEKDYLWGSVELVKWVTMDGTIEEGLLYKPENFDPKKKYPMIVYFYRLYSDNLYRHYSPRPSRSIINFTFYTSNGYLVFVPNIRYKIGYPGKSAYDYIVGGTSAMMNKYNFIDRKHIGVQGQSWGGYQVAYVVTQTNMFAAASAGAPVSDMISAYGGIRWESGMSRMFQYEQTQSRIGGTLWQKPLNYIENSPIFYAPNINTPLLIRHDDADGAVPWYQGIELFVALRRLNKPVWLLNYNGQPHNLKAKSPDCLDLSIRMKQFFDYYLKDKPAPKWLIKGVPAIQKGKDLGYELIKN